MSTDSVPSPSTRTLRSQAKQDPPAMLPKGVPSPSRTPAGKRNKQPDGFQVTPEPVPKGNPASAPSPRRKKPPKQAIATPPRPAPRARTITLQADTETLKESEKPPETDSPPSGTAGGDETQASTHSSAEQLEDGTNNSDGTNSSDETVLEEEENSITSEVSNTDKDSLEMELTETEDEDEDVEVREKKTTKKKKKKKKSKDVEKQPKKAHKVSKKKVSKKKARINSKRTKVLEKANSTSDEEEAMDESNDVEEEVEAVPIPSKTYAEAASQQDDDDDATVVAENDKWVARRVKISIEIKEPKDKEQRLKFLYAEVNQILKIGRKAVTSLQIRKFTDTRTPKSDQSKNWVSNFSTDKIEADDFCEFLAEGLKTWFPLDRTKFYFRATFVMPEKSSLSKMLEKLGHYLPNSVKVSDSLSQLIYEPKKVGYLLRSNMKMTSSEEFINELNRVAHQYNPKVHFGISYSEMKNPNGERAKDWKNAIKSILLETNENELREATDILLKIFPGKRYAGHKRIWGMNLVFVYDCAHEDVDNLDIAQRNISTLINRQQVHSKFELMSSTNKILPKALSQTVYKQSSDTLRKILMDIKSKTTKGCEGGQLFSSIQYSDYNKKKEYWFFYHKKVKKEAEAVVRALPAMLKYEMSISIDHFFYEGSFDDTDEWDIDTRTLRNAFTIATDNMLEGTEDLVMEEGEEADVDMQINEDKSISMNSLEKRECDRVMNLDDEETVLNPKKAKKLKPKSSKGSAQPSAPVIIDLDDNQSQMGSLAGSSLGMNSATASLTPSKSKAFQRQTLLEASNIVNEKMKAQTAIHNKQLKEAEEKQDKMEQYMRQMSAALANVGISLPTMPASQSAENSTTPTQKSGEKSDESQSDGVDPPVDDDPDITSPPRPLGSPVEHGDGCDFDWNGGLDENIAQEALDQEKEELRQLDRDRKRLEKEKARLLCLGDNEEEEYASDEDDHTQYTQSPEYQSDDGSNHGYVSAEDDLDNIEEADPDIDDYGDDEVSENTSRSGSVSGYDDGDREQDSGKSSSSSSSGSGSSESESSSSSDSDEDITKSVFAASTGKVATGGAPGGRP